MDAFAKYFAVDNAFAFLNLESLAYVAEAVLLLWAAKLINDMLHPGHNVNKELVEHDNKAFAVSFAGYMLGVGLVMLGVFSGGGVYDGAQPTLLENLGNIALWSMVGIILLNLARLINSAFVLYRFDSRKEVFQDRNVGTGAVQFGSYIGSALIIRTIISGESDASFGSELLDVCLLFLVAQIFFVIFGYVSRHLARYDVHDEIEKDNIAAGASFGISLIAIGIVLAHIFALTYSLAAIAVWFVNCLILLVAARWLVDRLIISGVKLNDEIVQDRNWGVALLEGGIALVVAFIITASF